MDGAIYLRRAHWQHLCNDSAWEFWRWDGKAWGWSKTDNPTAILRPTVKGTAIGEVNAQVIEGVLVLAYLDGPLGAVTRTSLKPDGVWSKPQVHATMLTAPNLYAPSVHPYSTLAKPFMHLSQWYNNLPNKGSFYGSRLWSMAPLADPRPVKDPEPVEPEVPAEPDTPVDVGDEDGQVCPDLSDMSAQELAELLTRDTDVNPAELAAALQSRADPH